MQTLMLDSYSVPYRGYQDNDFYEINRKWRRRIYAREELDWYIKERNQGWHETYFSRQAVKDHQAKGNCRFAMLCLEYMESQGWLQDNDLILDPMCGIGSFLIVAALKGYSCIGVELELRYYNNMIGYNEIIREESLFCGIPVHVEGSLEAFRKATDWKADVGSISVVNHDARNLQGVILKFPENSTYKDRLNTVLCSPPYGNRFSDETQQLSSRKNHKGYVEFNDVDWSERKQYSKDSDNIGNDKIKVICSPPYGTDAKSVTSGHEDYNGIDWDGRDNASNRSDDNIGKNKIKVICSPPYTSGTEASHAQATTVKEYTGQKAHVYSDNSIAVLDSGAAYNREMRKVYKSLYSVLGSGSHVCLITRNFIQQKKVVFLDELTVRLMQSAEFTYLETKRASLPNISFFKRNNWQKFFAKKGLPLIDWEEATFYVKE